MSLVFSHVSRYNPALTCVENRVLMALNVRRKLRHVVLRCRTLLRCHTLLLVPHRSLVFRHVSRGNTALTCVQNQVLMVLNVLKS